MGYLIFKPQIKQGVAYSDTPLNGEVMVVHNGATHFLLVPIFLTCPSKAHVKHDHTINVTPQQNDTIFLLQKILQTCQDLMHF